MYGLAKGEIRGSVSNKKNVSSSLSVGYSRSDSYIQNSDYQMINSLFQTNYLKKDKAKINFSFGYNQKHFGASTFYSPAYPPTI